VAIEYKLFCALPLCVCVCCQNSMLHLLYCHTMFRFRDGYWRSTRFGGGVEYYPKRCLRWFWVLSSGVKWVCRETKPNLPSVPVAVLLSSNYNSWMDIKIIRTFMKNLRAKYILCVMSWQIKLIKIFWELNLGQHETKTCREPFSDQSKDLSCLTCLEVSIRNTSRSLRTKVVHCRHDTAQE